MARRLGTRGTIVEGCERTGTVQQRPIATTGKSDADIWKKCGVVSDRVHVGIGVEANDIHPAEEISQGSHSVVPSLG